MGQTQRGMSDGVADPIRRGASRLPDGRRLGWAEWGPEDGAVVLFCPGAGTSARLGFGADVVGELGVRLIGLDRPGLGQSDPSPGRTLSDFAEDVRAFIAAQSLSAPRIAGFSQGAPFALACAAAGIVEAAAIVSGTDELASPVFTAALPPDLGALVDGIAQDPSEAEALFSRMDARTMHDMVVRMSSESDRAIFAEPGFDRAYREALREGFAQGPAGYARDTILTMSRWPFDPAQIAVPVDLWYGREDTSPTHAPDFGATLARRIPGARHHLLPAGSGLLWTHARAILASLVAS